MHDALKKAEEERARRRGGLADASPSRARSDSPRTETAPKDRPAAESPRPAEQPRGLRALLDTDAPELRPAAPPADHRRTGIAPSVIAFHRPDDHRAEQFRAMKSNLRALKPEPATLCLTSSQDDEGTSLVCANLACVFAEEPDARILVVDGNLRGSRMAELLALDEDAPGLSDVLAGSAKPEDVILKTAIPGVFCVLGGRQRKNPGGLLASRRLAEALSAWSAKHDRVLVDSPPVIGVNDAAVIGHQTDALALVIKLAATPREMVDRALGILRGAGTRVVGCILTNADATALVAEET